MNKFLESLKKEKADSYGIEIEIGGEPFWVVPLSMQTRQDILADARILVRGKEYPGQDKEASEEQKNAMLEKIGDIDPDQIVYLFGEIETHGDIARVMDQLLTSSRLIALESVVMEDGSAIYSNEEEKKEIMSVFFRKTSVIERVQNAITYLGEDQTQKKIVSESETKSKPVEA